MTAHVSKNLSLIPLVIGVTGHRDLREKDVPTLTDRVKAVFDELAAQHPDTPLILLSPLAEGADRLVARAALQWAADLNVSLELTMNPSAAASIVNCNGLRT